MTAVQSTANKMHWNVTLPNGETIAISAACEAHALAVAAAHWSYIRAR